MFLSFSLSVNIVFVNERVYYNGESVCLSVRPSLSVFLTTKGVCLRCSGVCNITCVFAFVLRPSVFVFVLRPSVFVCQFLSSGAPAKILASPCLQLS